MITWGLSVIVSTAVRTQTSQQPPIEELTRSIQEHYESLKNFSANFVHTYTGGLLRTTLTEHGTVLIKKPGMMRWHYEEPEEKLFVSDGIKMYSFIPFDRQVIVSRLPSEANLSTPVLFLIGEGNLLRDFTAVYSPSQDMLPDTWSIQLNPKIDAVYESLTLTVNRVKLSIMQLSTTDFQGAVSTFTFTDLRENIVLSDAIFNFEIPKNTEIIYEEDFNR